MTKLTFCKQCKQHPEKLFWPTRLPRSPPRILFKIKWEAIFVEWICKLSVSWVINTNLNHDQAGTRKDESDSLLQQYRTNNPFINVERVSFFNTKTQEEIKRMVDRAKLKRMTSCRHYLCSHHLLHISHYHNILPAALKLWYPIPQSALDAIKTPH